MVDIPCELFDFIDGVENDLFDTEFEEDYRFGSEENVEFLTAKSYSANTSRKIQYVLRLWKDWVNEKNLKLRLSTTSVPTKSFHEFTDEELLKWVPFFLAEIRTRKKEPWPLVTWSFVCAYRVI